MQHSCIPSQEPDLQSRIELTSNFCSLQTSKLTYPDNLSTTEPFLTNNKRSAPSTIPISLISEPERELRVLPIEGSLVGLSLRLDRRDGAGTATGGALDRDAAKGLAACWTVFAGNLSGGCLVVGGVEAERVHGGVVFAVVCC